MYVVSEAVKAVKCSDPNIVCVGIGKDSNGTYFIRIEPKSLDNWDLSNFHLLETELQMESVAESLGRVYGVYFGLEVRKYENFELLDEILQTYVPEIVQIA